jgi:3-hydroxyisobutyrate dehydrogenase-like beta-hydroxyacid dehydrogenase
MTVGIFSSGHMGSGLGWALREGGARVVTTLERRSARTARLAADAGIEPLPSVADLVREADIVLVVTPPGAALDAAGRLAAAARLTGTRPLVADLNAIAPSTVDSLVRVLADAGLDCVDGSVSGPPPTSRPGARLYFSGPRASEVADLPWRHVLPITLPGPAGQASALKMCTASVYKGLNGLLTQAVRTAGHHGVLDEALADLRANGLDHVGGIAPGATKAHRYVPEMLEIAVAHQAAGLPPSLFRAFGEVYAEIARTPLAEGDPESTARDLTPAELVRRLIPKQPPPRTARRSRGSASIKE